MASSFALTPEPPVSALSSGVIDYRHPESVRRRIVAMEHLLEGLVPIPFLRTRFGLDVVLDLIPVGGSVIAATMGAWILWEARNLRVSKWTMVKMAGNIGLDFALGAIPVIGVVPDYFFRSNSRNLKLLKRWMDNNPG